MKQKLVLLLMIVIMIATGYILWDRSYREEITDQDIARVTSWMTASGYGTDSLQIVNLYDKYDHAVFLYAWNDRGYVILFKNSDNFVEGGDGLRYSGYLTGEYKLYYFAPMGYYAGPINLDFKQARAQGLLHDIHAEWMENLLQSNP